MATRHRLKAALLGITLLFGVGLTPKTASAAEFQCAGGFGTKTPVLLVHGLNSNPDTWDKGEPSTKAALNSIGEKIVVEAFDYSRHHYRWVTHQQIGPKLAKHIACLSKKSLEYGGDGKVIGVGHSLGGLALREATRYTVDGRKVSDMLGLAITLGSPHKGTPVTVLSELLPKGYCALWAAQSEEPNKFREYWQCETSSAVRAMRDYDKRIRELPAFPPLLPVRTIAGDVTVAQRNWWNSYQIPTNSDLVVPVASATYGHTNFGRGDGKFVFGCSAYRYAWQPIKKWSLDHVPCWHNGMLGDFAFQEAVKNGILEYLASTEDNEEPTPEPSPTPTPTDEPTPMPSASPSPSPSPCRTDLPGVGMC